MTVRGWCPGLYDPMPSGDGLLARIRPPRGRLETAQAVALDELAAACGNGLIEITSRGNLQLRGVHAHARLIDGVCALGLAERDPARERRRRVMPAPFADAGLIDLVETALVECPAADRLPPKFAVRVDGGAVPIDGVPADLAVGPDGTVSVPAGIKRVQGPLGPIGDAFAVAPRFGQFAPGGLAALARGAGATLRLTPFRSVVVRGASSGFADGLDLIASPADPWSRVMACPGAPRCASGLGPARDVAARYLHLLPESGILHISGCEKGCAWQGEAVMVIPGAAA